MPYRCVVPHCKGNGKNGHKVRVFSFLKDKTLCDIWMHTIKKTLSDIWACAIKRMIFYPNYIFSQVGIFHIKKKIN